MHGKSGKIVIAGNLIVDNVKTLPAWPERGMLVTVSGAKRSVGGPVADIGIDLKRFDRSLEVAAIAKVGVDDAGEFAVDALWVEEIDTRGVSWIKGASTSTVDCLVLESTGERKFLCLRGAGDLLEPDDVDVSKLDCDIFHLGYLLLLGGMDAPDEEYGTKAARLLAKVQAAGIKTSVDIVSEQSERFGRIVRPALRYCDYCVISDTEASLTTGVDKGDMRGLCEGLRALGVRECAAVYGPEGSAAMDADGRFCSLGPLELPDGWVKGEAGAGDAFCAGMLYSFLRGMPTEEGMRLASCAAALNLSAVDGTSAAKSFSETLELENRFPRRKIY